MPTSHVFSDGSPIPIQSQAPIKISPTFRLVKGKTFLKPYCFTSFWQARIRNTPPQLSITRAALAERRRAQRVPRRAGEGTTTRTRTTSPPLREEEYGGPSQGRSVYLRSGPGRTGSTQGGRSSAPSSSPCRGAPALGRAQERGPPSAAGHRRGPASVPGGRRGAASDTPSPRPNYRRTPCGEAPGTASASRRGRTRPRTRPRPGPVPSRPLPPHFGAFLSPPPTPRSPPPPAAGQSESKTVRAPVPRYLLPPNGSTGGGETARSTNQSVPGGTNRQRARRGFKNASGLTNGQRGGTRRRSAAWRGCHGSAKAPPPPPSLGPGREGKDRLISK